VSDYGDVVASVMDAERARVPAAVGAPQLELAQKPIFKSAGGKGRLIPQLVQHLPPGGCKRYLEPFCGGAALFFALAPRDGAVLADLNPEIVELYAALAHDVETVIRFFSEHVWRHEQDAHRHYYFMRELFNDDAVEMGIHERAALVLYLNRACFNGLWRVNRAGKFNVPIGKHAHGIAISPDRLRAAASLLSRARLIAGDYRPAIAFAEPGDLCYLDPPYDETFTSYTRSGFDVDEQTNLEANARALADRGVRVMLSNADTSLVRELYRDRTTWHVSEIVAPRSIAANGQRRNKAAELIITSYAPRGRAS
jgi:DNA adenine methylase